MPESIANKAVLNDAERISKLLMTGFIFSVAVVVLKVTAGTEVTVPGLGIKLSMQHVWIALVVFTIAHGYLVFVH
jgi:hypothetical protein